MVANFIIWWLVVVVAGWWWLWLAGAITTFDMSDERRLAVRL